MIRNDVSSITAGGIAINNPEQGSLIVSDVATASRANNEQMEENNHENHCSSTQINRDQVKRTQNIESSDSYQMPDKEGGKREQSLSNDLELKSCNVQDLDTHNDTLQTYGSDTNARNMSEIDDLKQVVDMGGVSSSLSKQDLYSEDSFPSEDTTQTNREEPHHGDTAASSTVRKGTEIQFRGLNLEENVSTLRGNRTMFTLECNRCRQRIDQQLSASGYVVFYETHHFCGKIVQGLHRSRLINNALCTVKSIYKPSDQSGQSFSQLQICSIKSIRVFLFPPGRDASPLQGYLSALNLYTWVKRDILRVK